MGRSGILRDDGLDRAERARPLHFLVASSPTAGQTRPSMRIAAIALILAAKQV